MKISTLSGSTTQSQPATQNNCIVLILGLFRPNYWAKKMVKYVIADYLCLIISKQNPPLANGSIKYECQRLTEAIVV